MIKAIAALITSTTLVGCGHFHGNYAAPYYGVGWPVHYPAYGYSNYSPYYGPYHNQQTYAPTYNSQNINNNLNVNTPGYYDIGYNETRRFYIYEPLMGVRTYEDGTIQDIGIVEQHRFRVRDCRTTFQVVNANNYSSTQYAGCN